MTLEGVREPALESSPLTQSEQLFARFALDQYGVELEPCEARALTGMLLQVEPPDDADSGLRFDIVTAPQRKEASSPAYQERHGVLNALLASARNTHDFTV